MELHKHGRGAITSRLLPSENAAVLLMVVLS